MVNRAEYHPNPFLIEFPVPKNIGGDDNPPVFMNAGVSEGLKCVMMNPTSE